jgi:hypothetical protein
MPKPPRETMGGFVSTVFETQKQTLDAEIVLVKELINSKEFESYDNDFQMNVKSRLILMDDYKSKIENL